MTASFSSLSVDRKKVLAVLAAGTFSSRIRAGRRPTVSSRGASGSPNKMARIADVSMWREPTAVRHLPAILKILLQTTVASQLTVPLQSAFPSAAPTINRSPAILRLSLRRKKTRNPENPPKSCKSCFRQPSHKNLGCIPLQNPSLSPAHPTPNPPQTPPTYPQHPPPPHPRHAQQNAPQNPKHPPASTHIPCSPAD